ncbi:MAG: hypothetical protein K6C98_09215 [Treponema sp.]|nr:hypothetical protein [Treponema sp.]
MNKKIFFLNLLACLFMPVFSQSNESEFVAEGEALEAFDEDFDAMFDQASDTEAVIVVDPKASAKNDDGTYPLRFSGRLDSEFGLGWQYYDEYVDGKEYVKINNKPVIQDKIVEGKNDPNGYFTFTNYLYLNSHPTPDTMVKGTFAMGFPGYEFAISECYFDYIVKNKLYFTAGKKQTTWGYPRLLTVASNATTVKVDEFVAVGAENTNILFDSRKGTSFMLRVPVWTGTITGLAMYQGTNSQPSFEDMIFAASVEMIIQKTSFNVFGRGGEHESTKITYSDENGLLKNETKEIGPLLGLEVKRTILGADVYGQGLCRFDSNEKFGQAFKQTIHGDSFHQMVFTGGFYKWWDAKDPAVGFNIEYQLCCKFNKDDSGEYSGKDTTHRIAFDGGVKRLGPNHNIKVGVELNHDITNNKGYIKPGVIISGLLPNCDWKNGVRWDYGEPYTSKGKWTFGTYIDLSLNY